jgi:hypothetical protein
MSSYGYDTKSEPLKKNGKLLVCFFHFGRRVDFFVYVTPEEWKWIKSFNDLTHLYGLFREFDKDFNPGDKDERATPEDRANAKRLMQIMHRKHEPTPFNVAWISL